MTKALSALIARVCAPPATLVDRAVARLITEPLVLACQSAPPPPDNGPKRLARAIFAQALTDLRAEPPRTTEGFLAKQAADAHEDALRWFASDEMHPFSFAFVCQVFGWEPAFVRRGIARLTRTVRHPPAGRGNGRIMADRRDDEEAA